jgi:hypothetical protein
MWQVRNFLGMDTHSDDIEAPPLSTSAGILYVNVMECRNLPMRDPAANKSPSAYCEIQLANSVILDVLPTVGKENVKLTEQFPDSRGPRVRTDSENVYFYQFEPLSDTSSSFSKSLFFQPPIAAFRSRSQ